MSGSNAFRSARNCAALLLLAAALAPALPRPAPAEEPSHRLRGLFCNSEEQLDEALGHMRRNVTPPVAAALTNDEEIVCTYVDLLDYIVEEPLIIGEFRGAGPAVKYQAKLVGLVVGGNVRPVSPPATVFFISSDRIPGAVVESRA